MIRVRGGFAGAVSALVVGGIVLATTLPASAAADVSTGQWYLDAFHIGDAQSSGLTGDGVTIAVIDSSINTAIPTLASANITVREPSYCLDDSGAFLPAVTSDLTGANDAFHGTTVAAMITGTGDGYDGQTGIRGIAPGAKVLYYAASTSTGAGDGTITCRTQDGSDDGIETAVATAMNEAMDAGADIISVSMILNGTADLIDAIIRAHREGVVVLGGLPNKQINVAGSFPAAANGVVAVQSIDSTGTPPTEDLGGVLSPIQFPYTTVSGPGIGVLAQGAEGGAWEDQQLVSGTSYATPAVAGFLALVKQQYPSATSNQLIQSLIRNTGATDHDLVRDDAIGYGIASVTHMLANDPAQYTDENPLITPDGLPSPEQIAAAPTPTSSPEPGDGPAAAGSPLLIIVLVAAGVLLVIAIIIVIIIVATRRARGGSPRT